MPVTDFHRLVHAPSWIKESHMFPVGSQTRRSNSTETYIPNASPECHAYAFPPRPPPTSCSSAMNTPLPLPSRRSRTLHRAELVEWMSEVMDESARQDRPVS